MAISYAQAIARDEAGVPLQEFPAPVKATKTTVAVTAISSVFTFDNSSTSIEITAPNSPVAWRWLPVGSPLGSVVSSYATAANFDHIIPSGQLRRFVIPRETQGIAGPALANSVHGLYQFGAAIPLNGTAAASILVSEF